MEDTRKDQRVKVQTLKAKYKSATIEEFIEQYAGDISRGGIFIKTPKPAPNGTLLKIEIQLRDASPVISAVGRVAWRRETATGREPAGMGIKFIKVEESSQKIIDRIVATKGEGAGPHFEEESSAEDTLAKPAGETHSEFFGTTNPQAEMPGMQDRTMMRQMSAFLTEAVRTTTATERTSSLPPPPSPSRGGNLKQTIVGIPGLQSGGAAPIGSGPVAASPPSPTRLGTVSTEAVVVPQPPSSLGSVGPSSIPPAPGAASIKRTIVGMALPTTASTVVTSAKIKSDEPPPKPSTKPIPLDSEDEETKITGRGKLEELIRAAEAVPSDPPPVARVGVDKSNPPPFTSVTSPPPAASATPPPPPLRTPVPQASAGFAKEEPVKPSVTLPTESNQSASVIVSLDEPEKAVTPEKVVKSVAESGSASVVGAPSTPPGQKSAGSQRIGIQPPSLPPASIAPPAKSNKRSSAGMLVVFLLAAVAGAVAIWVQHRDTVSREDTPNAGGNRSGEANPPSEPNTETPTVPAVAQETDTGVAVEDSGSAEQAESAEAGTEAHDNGSSASAPAGGGESADAGPSSAAGHSAHQAPAVTSPTPTATGNAPARAPVVRRRPAGTTAPASGASGSTTGTPASTTPSAGTTGESPRPTTHTNSGSSGSTGTGTTGSPPASSGTRPNIPDNPF